MEKRDTVVNSAATTNFDERARHFGWPNTYVFTKAMGEMFAGNFKDDLPLVIIRPTIITRTFKEPFPGWIEGLRTIDRLSVGYGKGKLTCFPGNPKTIPADMVINATIVAMAHVNRSFERSFTMLRNLMKCPNLPDFSRKHFTNNPLIDHRNGKPSWKSFSF
ncbi:Male sterility, NAD-binding protein [Corchorus olitorius]|uniref:Fatty acyl-CoA reductase n=1 Tax=Corchorus olitorius TaxID=93759 RepID=A0A1R3J2P7_9ROSI|nr:Male sterility, NAD-binding protein [Corchorus olitorius]